MAGVRTVLALDTWHVEPTVGGRGELCEGEARHSLVRWTSFTGRQFIYRRRSSQRVSRTPRVHA